MAKDNKNGHENLKTTINSNDSFGVISVFSRFRVCFMDGFSEFKAKNQYIDLISFTMNNSEHQNSVVLPPGGLAYEKFNLKFISPFAFI